MGDYPRLSEGALNAVICVLVRGRQREILCTDTHRGDRDVKVEQREV